MTQTPVWERDTIIVVGREGVPGSYTQKPRPRLPNASPAYRPAKRGRALKWVAWTMIVVGTAGLSLVYAAWQGRHSASAASALHLQVQLEPTGEGLLLRWERSAIPAGAITLLGIQDGDRTELALIDPSVARLGAVTYNPESENLRFRLTVKDAQNGDVLAQESTAVAYAKPVAAENIGRR